MKKSTEKPDEGQPEIYSVFDSICRQLAELRENNPVVLEAYDGLQKRLKAATESLKLALLDQGIDPRWDGHRLTEYAAVTAGVRNERSVENLDMLAALLPAGLVDEVIERRVSFTRLDEAIKRGEVREDRVEPAIKTESKQTVTIKIAK
jgi:hypothetical protein